MVALARRFLAVLGGLVITVGLACPAFAADGPPYGQCSGKDLSTCDSDNDGISNAIEYLISGSATGATGAEDSDGDGLPDWVEIEATNTKTEADPSLDTLGTGIPDYAYLIVCGKVGCDGAWDDDDADNVPNWVEVVICGTKTCATGLEDYNHDGQSDAAQLIACAKPLPSYTAPVAMQAGGVGSSSGKHGLLALTGAQVAGTVIASVVLVCAGAAALLASRRRRSNANSATETATSTPED